MTPVYNKSKNRNIYAIVFSKPLPEFCQEGAAEKPVDVASGVASGFTGDPTLGMENSWEVPKANAEQTKASAGVYFPQTQ